MRLENTDIAGLAKELLNDGFNEMEIKEGMREAMNFISKIPEEFKVYRILKLNDLSELNTNSLGYHWTMNKSMLMDSYYFNEDTNYFMLTARTSKESVNMFKTFKVNVMWPAEKEVFIDGRVDLLSVNKIDTH